MIGIKVRAFRPLVRVVANSPAIVDGSDNRVRVCFSPVYFHEGLCLANLAI